MGEFWDAERGTKAAVWCAFYMVLWLLMQLSCEVGLPSNCTAVSEPMDVLTELPFLVAFAVGQAFFCDILDVTRSHALKKRWYFPVFVVASAVITSALMLDDEFEDLHESGQELTTGAAVVSVLLLVFVALVFLYHFFLAWKLLPGGWVGWGLSSGRVPETSPSPVRENRFLQYLATTLLITVYVILFAVFARKERAGWDYHYVLLAWVMSLISTFDDPISVTWLGMTTGVFLQGVGAYSFRVLIPDFRD
eukprot:g12245.t1